MKDLFLKVWVRIQILRDDLREDNGQDLIEYALVAALIALAAVTAMGSVGTKIDALFDDIATKVKVPPAA